MEKRITEKQIEKALVEGVKKLGGAAYKFVSPGHAGVPDRMIVLPGGAIIFAELKRPGGKTTPLQDAEIKKMQSLGCNVGVISGIAEVKACLEYCRMHIKDREKGAHEV